MTGAHSPRLSYRVEVDGLKTMHPDRLARILAFLFRMDVHVYAVALDDKDGAIELTVSPHDAPKMEKISEKVLAVVESSAIECPCGCKADMTIGECYRNDPRYHQPGQLTPEERLMVDGGSKILAIKAYRTRMGTGLAEAKQAVDKYDLGRSPYALKAAGQAFCVCGQPSFGARSCGKPGH